MAHLHLGLMLPSLGLADLIGREAVLVCARTGGTAEI